MHIQFSYIRLFLVLLFFFGIRLRPIIDPSWKIMNETLTMIYLIPSFFISVFVFVFSFSSITTEYWTQQKYGACIQINRPNLRRKLTIVLFKWQTPVDTFINFIIVNLFDMCSDIDWIWSRFSFLTKFFYLLTMFSFTFKDLPHW